MPHDLKPQTNTPATLGSVSRPDGGNLNDDGVSRETSSTYKGAAVQTPTNPLPGMTVQLTPSHVPGKVCNYVELKYNQHRGIVTLPIPDTESDHITTAMEITKYHVGIHAGSLLASITSTNKQEREEAKRKIRALKKLGKEIHEYVRAMVPAMKETQR